MIFCAHDGELVAVHGFIKKSQTTPPLDLDLALKRKRTLAR
jgi:phage-related protein